MKSDKVVYWSTAFVIIMMLVWTTVVIYSIGPDSVWAIISGKSKTQIESLGQLGASYGVLAALFAGFAVVLLLHSIGVQQKELTQLKEQMEHDRDIREYTWLIDAFCDARTRLVLDLGDTSHTFIYREFRGFYSTNKNYIYTGDKYISLEAKRYLRHRHRGDFNEYENIEKYIDYHLHSKDTFQYVLDPFDTYLAALKQISYFIDELHYERKNKYLNILASVTNKYDLIIIHEQTLLRRDHMLKKLLESTGLLGIHGGALLYLTLRSGPRLSPRAFGERESNNHKNDTKP